MGDGPPGREEYERVCDDSGERALDKRLVVVVIADVGVYVVGMRDRIMGAEATDDVFTAAVTRRGSKVRRVDMVRYRSEGGGTGG